MTIKLTRSQRPEILRLHLEEHLTFTAIADRLGVTSARILQIVREEGVTAEESRLATLPSRRTGRKCLHRSGHVLVYLPEHHRAKSNGFVYEHIIVAEQAIGRPIQRGEHVHHINHDPADNRPENLRVVSPREHMRIHHGVDREYGLNRLRALAIRLGRTPSATDIRRAKLTPNVVWYFNHFGSLRKAQAAAGLVANDAGGGRHRVKPLPSDVRRAA